jgi:hypothetical protein
MAGRFDLRSFRPARIEEPFMVTSFECIESDNGPDASPDRYMVRSDAGCVIVMIADGYWHWTEHHFTAKAARQIGEALLIAALQEY